MKTCTKCNTEKPLSHFHKYKRSKDGVRTKCKDCRKEEYNLNSEYKKRQARENYLKNAERVKEYQKQYKKNNRDLINNRERKYKSNRRNNDALFLLKENISCLIRNSLKLYNHKKDTKTENILGCSVKEFKEYLNDNLYGFTYDDKNIDLDHIVPISSAKSQECAIALNHYSNFQLLPKEYNRNIKIDNPFDLNHFENWLGARALEKITKMRQ